MLLQTTEEEEEERLEATLTSLFNTRGGLSDCLSCCDEVLASLSSSSSSTPNRSVLHFTALTYRATILVYIACDNLAARDLSELLRLYPGEYSQIEPTGDCPPSFVCSTAEWHRVRRFAMLRRHPELKLLYNNTSSDVHQTMALLGLMILLHVACMAVISSSSSGNHHWWLALTLASTVGSVCAYSFQALTHELAHMVFANTSSPAFYLCTLAGSLCNFPWHYYYFNYHNRHHAHTGAEKDRDGDILFRAWHCPPTISRPKQSLFWNLGQTRLSRWAWTGAFAVGIYFMFCRAKRMLDATHEPSFKYEGPMVVLQLLVWYWFGWAAWAYVWMSAAFSLGAFGHPYIQFWLTQHAFVAHREGVNLALVELAERFSVPLLQPTVSGNSSSALWQALNFGELRHVEHHDFPVVGFWRAYKVPLLCPEFYSGLHRAEYLKDLDEWLASDYNDGFTWMKTRGDFAGRAYYLRMLWRIMMEEEEEAEAEQQQQLEEDEEGDNQEEADVVQVWQADDDVDEMSEPEVQWKDPL